MSKDNEIRTDCRKLNVVNCHRAVSVRCAHRSCRLRFLPTLNRSSCASSWFVTGNIQLINGSSDPSKVLQPRHTYNVFPSKDKYNGVLEGPILGSPTPESPWTRGKRVTWRVPEPHITTPDHKKRSQTLLNPDSGILKKTTHEQHELQVRSNSVSLTSRARR